MSSELCKSFLKHEIDCFNLFKISSFIIDLFSILISNSLSSCSTALTASLKRTELYIFEYPTISENSQMNISFNCFLFNINSF